jgi:hypothetical protein
MRRSESKIILRMTAQMPPARMRFNKAIARRLWDATGVSQG